MLKMFRQRRQNGRREAEVSANLDEHQERNFSNLTRAELAERLLAAMDSDAASSREIEAHINALELAPSLEETLAEEAYTPEKALARFKQNQKVAQEKKRRNYLREIAAAAAVFAVVFTSGSFLLGAQWSKTLVSWSEEIFQMSPGEGGQLVLAEPEGGGYSSMSEALLDYGLEDVSPTWIPEGYALDEVRVYDGEYPITFIAVYENADEKSLRFTVDYYPKVSGSPFFEKDGEKVEILSIDGQEYYLFSNLGKNLVAWNSGPLICGIQSEESQRELKRIVRSIN